LIVSIKEKIDVVLNITQKCISCKFIFNMRHYLNQYQIIKTVTQNPPIPSKILEFSTILINTQLCSLLHSYLNCGSVLIFLSEKIKKNSSFALGTLWFNFWWHNVHVTFRTTNKNHLLCNCVCILHYIIFFCLRRGSLIMNSNLWWIWYWRRGWTWWH